MLVLSLLALLLFSVSAVLVIRAVALPRMKSAEQVRAIEFYGYQAAIPAVAGAGSAPAFSELAARLGATLGARFGTTPEEMRKVLVSAGFYRLSPAALLGYRVLLALALGLLVFAAGAPGGVFLAFVWSFFGALFGFFLPIGYVQRTARVRMAEVDRELPDLIDLIVVMVEAGMTLSAALQLASTKFDGPLGQELRLTLQEQRMGRSLHDALLGMLGRCDTPNVRSFVRSVTQGESLGVSIGSIMRSLAEEMRKRRRSSAEKQAQKAPVKILFPLIFLILPAFVISIMTSPIIRIFDSIGS